MRTKNCVPLRIHTTVTAFLHHLQAKNWLVLGHCDKCHIALDNFMTNFYRPESFNRLLIADSDPHKLRPCVQNNLNTVKRAVAAIQVFHYFNSGIS